MLTQPSRDAVVAERAPTGLRRDLPIAVALAAALMLISFTTAGGDVDLAASTWTAIALTLVGFGLLIGALLLGARAPVWGGAALALFAALALLSALSVAWSVVPDKSWVEAGRIAGYMGAFAAALALARLVPARWSALLSGILLASVALSAWAVAVKVFPATLDRQQQFGRLLEPFGYWNATGLMAALGLPPCLWLGTRREGSTAARAVAVPAVALLVAVVVLSYSRSALLAALVGLAVWLVAVPRRLRAAMVLALGGAGGAVIAGWALREAAFKHDIVPLATRVSEGRTFGVVVVGVLAAVAVAGYLALSRADHEALSAQMRRRLGIALICLVALIPFAGLGAVAASSRGLSGEASHLWNELTTTKGVGDNPNRLGSLANSRSAYWHEGLTVGGHALVAGVGADGFGTAQTRYTDDTLPAGHAHSYLIQTFADLGLIGLALSLGLLAAWSVAVARPLKQPALATDALAAERSGMWTLLCVVLTFGVSSAIDWTWEYAGVAVPALIAAGWLAGRGPLGEHVGLRPQGSPSGLAARLAATALAASALVISWLIWQPLRSSDADAAAVAALTQGNSPAALADANAAVSRDPLAVAPLWIRSEIYSALGDRAHADAQAQAAVSLQPENPQTWAFLGALYLATHQPNLALAALTRAHALDLANPGLTQQLAAARAASAGTSVQWRRARQQVRTRG
jgi:tetratricopeptide (TPR) repeat protein